MNAPIDLTGQKFGRLLVLEKAKIRQGHTHWRCLCDCGNETFVESYQLKSGTTKSCGCLAKELCSQRCLIDLTGKRFGKLTVVKRASKIGEPVRWECLCDCGNTTFVQTHNLKRGRTKSCGCAKYVKKHGLVKTRIYRIWGRMKARCYNPNEKSFKNYGGRGITICDEWLNDFSSFYNWSMQNGYSDSLEIDRINNDLGYSPSNCRWITHQEQQYNKRTNRLVTYNDETKPLKSWTEELGLDYHRVNLRLLNGWDVEDAFWSSSDEHFKKIHGNAHHMKAVIQYDLEMNLIGIYDSIKQAAQATNIDQRGISRCCHEKQKQCKNFIWKFKVGDEED